MVAKLVLLAALAAFGLFVAALEAEERTGEPNSFTAPLSLAWPALLVVGLAVALGRRSNRPRPRDAAAAPARDESCARGKVDEARTLAAAGLRRSAVVALASAVTVAHRDRDLAALRDAIALAVRLSRDDRPRARAIDELVAAANVELEHLGAEPLEERELAPPGGGSASPNDHDA